MDEETTKFVAEARSLCDMMRGLEDQYKPASLRGIARNLAFSAGWFLVPLVALWGMGVSPEWAARFATGSFVIVVAGLAVLSAVGAFVIRAGTTGIEARLDAIEKTSPSLREVGVR